MVYCFLYGINRSRLGAQQNALRYLIMPGSVHQFYEISVELVRRPQSIKSVFFRKFSNLSHKAIYCAGNGVSRLSIHAFEVIKVTNPI